MRSGLLDSGLRRVKQRKHPDIVAAVKGDRDVGLAQHLHGSARQLEVFAVHNVEDLGEARIFIAAQRGIDNMIGDDARLIVIKSDAVQRTLRQIAGVHDAQMDSSQCHNAYLRHVVRYVAVTK
jgi:hypothetical protein